jgi:hypothetical protein
MPNQQKPQQTEPFGNMRQSFNLFWLVINGYATCILPFLRRGFAAGRSGPEQPRPRRLTRRPLRQEMHP